MSSEIMDALPVDPEPAPPVSPTPPVAFPLHPNFWWGILWCIGLLLFTQIPGAVVAIVIIFGGMFLTPGLISADDMGSSSDMMGNPVAQVAMGAGVVTAHLLIIALSLLMLRLVVGRDWPRQVALRLPSLTHVLLIFALLPAFMVLANGGYYVFRKVLEFPSMLDLIGMGGMEGMEESFGGWPLIAGALIIGLLPGISEELWCRAYLGRGLVGKHGYLLGVLGTSFLFGAIHVDPCQGGMAMLVGIVIHFVYLTSRSLLVPMLLHFLNNSLAVGLTRIPKISTILPDSTPAPWFHYAAAGMLLIAVCWAFYQSRARLIHPPGEDNWQPPYPGVDCPPSTSATTIHTPGLSLVSLGLVLVSLAAFSASVYVLWNGQG